MIAAAIELLLNRVWSRNPEDILSSTTRSSPATILPQEVVEMVIAYLIYDTRSVRACALTYYSWYTAVVPHLHHTLTVHASPRVQKFQQPYPLLYMDTLGLLPSVKEFRVLGYGTRVWFSRGLFDWYILHHFSALTNVQELEI